MEEYFKEFFKRNVQYSEESQKIQVVEDFISSFKESEDLAGKKIKNLIFLQICEKYFGDIAFFKFDESTTIYKYSTDGPDWFKISDRYELVQNKKSKLEGVHLLPKSSSEIKYILYPFEQGMELPIEILQIENNVFVNKKTLTNVEVVEHNGIKIKWTNDLTCTIDDDGKYEIFKNGVFLSGFVDEPTYFQLGDSCTKAYIDKNNNLIIYNYGDVSSCVIITKDF